jgi:hypothetical protein
MMIGLMMCRSSVIIVVISEEKRGIKKEGKIEKGES